MKPDFMLYNPGNQLLLVAEVKGTRNEDAQWAAKLRRNLISNGAIPNAPYFLLVLPEHVYLWKDAPATQEVFPNFISETKHVLRAYLGDSANDPAHLSVSGLELVVRSWLNDIADPAFYERASVDAKDLVEESGLATEILQGAVLCGDPT